MDINQVITREEYESTKDVSYDHFCSLIRKLVKLCVEESLKTLPQVVAHVSASAAYLRSTADEFYKRNPDLNAHRRVMAESVMKVESENPGMKYDKVLEKAAVEAREVIQKLSVHTEDGRRNLPTYDARLEELQ